MAFMDQFNPNLPQQQLLNALGMIKQVAGGNPAGVVQQLIQSGATCTLPDGSVIPVEQLAKMADGKTPQQMFAQFGPQYGQLQQQITQLL